MKTRMRITLALSALVVAGIFVSCNVTVNTGGDGGDPSLSFTNADKTFTFTLGTVGQFSVSAAGAPVQKAAAIPLFDEPPADTPASAAIELDISQVRAIPLGIPKLLPTERYTRIIPDDSSQAPKTVAQSKIEWKPVNQPGLAIWDGARGAFETPPRRTPVPGDGRSASADSPAPAGSTILQR